MAEPITTEAPPEEEWLSIIEAVARYSISRSSIYHLKDNGFLRTKPMPENHTEKRYNIKRQYVVAASDLDRWAAQRAVKNSRAQFRVGQLREQLERERALRAAHGQ